MVTELNDSGATLLAVPTAEAGGDALPAPAGTDPAVAALRSAVRTGWIDPYRV